MAVTENTTLTTDFTVQAREIDFVTQFDKNWDALREILGVMRPIRKQPGTKLKSYNATITLADGDVAEGDEIPLSKAKVEPVAYADLKFKKYDKRITIEDVDQYGAELAIIRTDEAMRNEIQSNIIDEFYDFAKTGTLTNTASTFQMGVAIAIGSVRDKFKKMRRNASDVVTFVNTMDAYKYLGAADISVQSLSGIDYMKNFMGARSMILSSEIDEGQIIAIPSNNILMYYADPADSDYKALGLNYTTGIGETNLIGFHAEPVYNRASGDTFAIYGMKLWAEYLDAIAVVSITDGSDETVSMAKAVSKK